MTGESSSARKKGEQEMKSSKKKFTHSVNMGTSAGKGKRTTGMNVSPLHNKGVSRKALTDIYNKYYRDQVSALYRAVID
jgi:hypothetical protein